MLSDKSLGRFVEEHRELLTALAESGTHPVDNLRALVRGIQPHEWALAWLVHEVLARGPLVREEYESPPVLQAMGRAVFLRPRSSARFWHVGSFFVPL